ncbi:hypothetical protein CLAFUW4_00247 [Fulvia fulva]|uniref:Uncharacterized protein n=1 Tax=Passalora fulva TaxID=5499 RepID=A0A9Q8L5A5_PASFU|nr:uncharacterized protein CLAFUR5_00247 [Fulvia fulva]KAK4634164.1 hypothetical protein CLAFUR4_00247 [Fulvia fulva]KAK4637141.1 hypothetical protein CLAFUR0_00248 [Fulvia fulva]UJO11081.1 hypothetical protein CLAFUR5_00247 [Fulvia fulva]WPV08208.1 hypothetical protein CLAFUW4_00247 [Fulvia fulva]WPV23860.1 hypothetical protein CLAFUW7_00251 [Fulvia fulva]
MASSTTPSSPTAGRRRGTSIASVTQSIVTTAGNVLNSDPPPGFLAATAEIASQAPTIPEIRRSSTGELSGGRRRSSSGTRRLSRGSKDVKKAQEQGNNANTLSTFPALSEVPSHLSSVPSDARTNAIAPKPVDDSQTLGWTSDDSKQESNEVRPLDNKHKVYANGYVPPPKLPWTTSTVIGLKAFWKWFLTPFGFLVTLYGLNVVAWGGMLFLLLCNASPAMCWTSDGQGGKFFDCNDINSPRRKWIEWDSQILNALFCVTGFGLVPWRFRDLYYSLCYRFTSESKQGREKKMYGLRKLAAHYRSWYRLPGSETLDAIVKPDEVLDSDLRLPLPASKRPNDPPTGERAPPTPIWKVDFFIWCQVWNTFFQCCLCGFMWGLNRHDRPSWSTGLFVALACGVAGVGGLVSFLEGKKVKRIEGVLPSAAVQKVLAARHDPELGLQQTRTEQESIHVRQEKSGNEVHQ